MSTPTITSTSMADGIRSSLYLVVNDSDRIEIVAGVTGLTDLGSKILLIPLPLAQIHSCFLILGRQRQTEFCDGGIGLGLVLDEHQRIGAGVTSTAFQRCQHL